MGKWKVMTRFERVLATVRPGRWIGVFLALFLLHVLASAGSASGADPIPVAVFDFELIDTSLEGEMSGERSDEQQRLLLISDQLRRQLED